MKLWAAVLGPLVGACGLGVTVIQVVRRATARGYDTRRGPVAAE